MGLFEFLFKTKPVNKSSISGNGMVFNQSATNAPGQDVEFSSDISAGMGEDAKDGVQFTDLPDSIKLVYSGKLADNNPESVFAVIGYGNNDNWEDTEEYTMQKTADKTFEILAHRKKAGNINAAFKDNAGNWDNNSGRNYVFFTDEDREIH